MSLIIPDPAALTVRTQFQRGLKTYWRERHHPDLNKRRHARQSIRAFCAILRQL